MLFCVRAFSHPCKVPTLQRADPPELTTCHWLPQTFKSQRLAQLVRKTMTQFAYTRQKKSRLFFFSVKSHFEFSIHLLYKKTKNKSFKWLIMILKGIGHNFMLSCFNRSNYYITTTVYIPFTLSPNVFQKETTVIWIPTSGGTRLKSRQYELFAWIFNRRDFSNAWSVNKACAVFPTHVT